MVMMSEYRSSVLMYRTVTFVLAGIFIFTSVPPR